MIKTYKTLCFKDKPCREDIPLGRLDCFQWEGENPYRPETLFKMCFVKEKGIFVEMKTNEKNLRSVCSKRDEPVYEDSCMEFFFKPFKGRQEYLNFEINPDGAYLSQFGKGRDDRVFIKELTDEKPVISTEKGSDGWKLRLFVPCALIESLYGERFEADEGEYRGNFYKCGDKTEKPHYGSFSPMSSLPPGFHNPERFAKIIVSSKIF